MTRPAGDPPAARRAEIATRAGALHRHRRRPARPPTIRRAQPPRRCLRRQTRYPGRPFATDQRAVPTGRRAAAHESRHLPERPPPRARLAERAARDEIDDQRSWDSVGTLHRSRDTIPSWSSKHARYRRFRPSSHPMRDAGEAGHETFTCRARRRHNGARGAAQPEQVGPATHPRERAGRVRKPLAPGPAVERSQPRTRSTVHRSSASSRSSVCSPLSSSPAPIRGARP